MFQAWDVDGAGLGSGQLNTELLTEGLQPDCIGPAPGSASCWLCDSEQSP